MPRTSKRRASATTEISPELLKKASTALNDIVSEQDASNLTEPGQRELETGRIAAELAEAFHRLAGSNVRAANRAGQSWASIGEVFDVAAQSAHERYRDR